MFWFRKWNHIVLPYKVEMEDDHILIEASGIYNEAFVVFRGSIISKFGDIKTIFIRLNENIVKEIGLIIEYRDINVFKFDFSNLLNEEEIKSIKVKDFKSIVGGVI